MWYQPPGDGGRGLASDRTAVPGSDRPPAGLAGMLREKDMRATRPSRKENVGDIVVNAEREKCRLMQEQKTRRKEKEKKKTRARKVVVKYKGE